MRNCKFCGKKIPAEKKSTAEFCSNGCKTNDYRQRKGIAPPDFLTKPATDFRRLLSEEDKQRNKILAIEISNIEQSLEPIENAYKQLHKILTDYEIHKTLPKNFLRIPPEPIKPSKVLPPKKPTYLDVEYLEGQIKDYQERYKEYEDKRKKIEEERIEYEKQNRHFFRYPVMEPYPYYDENDYKKYLVYKKELQEYDEYQIALNKWKVDYSVWEKNDGIKLGLEVAQKHFNSVKEKLEYHHAQIAEKKKQIAESIEAAVIEESKVIERAKPKKQSRISGADVQKMRFKTFRFNDYWSELMGSPSNPFSAMIYGDAKAGKSYFSLEFAQYLTEFGEVGYFVIEEGISKTTQNKVNQTKAMDIFLEPAESLDEIRERLSNESYQFAFIDSVSAIGMSAEEFEKLRQLFPETSFIAILQTTKANEFSGEKRWKHDVDAIIQIRKEDVNKSVITCEGRFGAGKREVEY